MRNSLPIAFVICGAALVLMPQIHHAILADGYHFAQGYSSRQRLSMFTTGPDRPTTESFAPPKIEYAEPPMALQIFSVSVGGILIALAAASLLRKTPSPALDAPMT